MSTTGRAILIAIIFAFIAGVLVGTVAKAAVRAGLGPNTSGLLGSTTQATLASLAPTAGPYSAFGWTEPTPRGVVGPTPTPTVEPSATPKVVRERVVVPASARFLVSGIASWYCGSICTSGYPSGFYAAAGPALRVGAWRGRVVTVCAGACVRVRLIDWCACGGGRVIDLYSAAFSRLAPLSVGVLGVSIRW